MLRGVERRMIWFPGRALAHTPAEARLAYEDVRFPAADGVSLHGWWVPAPGARTTLLWCHGNAGNIGDRVENLALFHDRLGVHVLLFDYRAYGQSDGAFDDLSEDATYADALGALAWLRARPEVAATNLVYFGRSLGAAVAVELARRHPPAALVLESPFTSIAQMSRRVVPLVPVGWLLATKYDSISKIGALRVPLLILHGEEDEVVPFEQGRRLFEAAREPKTFFAIPGAGHNDTWIVGTEAWLAAWERFLARLG